jgi:NADH-ubiquinone oxidoreductase chain 4
MTAHGLCSSGLFCLSYISYERFGRRRLLVSRGLINLMPSMAMWWFLLSVCNMAAPPLNVLGEVGLLSSLVSYVCFSSCLFWCGLHALYVFF